MFEQFMGKNKKEMQAEVAAEKRQYDFAREQTTMGDASNPQSDQMYMLDQNEKADLLKWQQELDSEMIKVINTLMGKVVVGNEVLKISDPICNILFIKEVIVPQCSAYMNRNLFNTNYQEKDILITLKNTMNDIDDAMSDHFDKYDIEFTKFDLIHRMIVNTIKPGIYRALNGWTKKTDSTISKRIEAFNETQQQPPKRGFFGIGG